MKKLLLILLFVLFAGNSWPAIYYVDTDSIGGPASDNNPGTIDEPWEIIDYVNSQLIAGDTVYLREGAYNADLYGAADNRYKHTNNNDPNFLNAQSSYPTEIFNSLSVDPLFTDRTNRDFTPQSNSLMINAGTHLTTITSSTNTGQTTIVVDDASYFYDGWTIPGEIGDTIKTEAGEETVIQSINYTTNTLTVSPAIDIINGEGLSLTYIGSAPDIGAFEYDMAISGLTPGGNSTGISITTDLNWTNPAEATSIDLFFDKKSEHDPPTTVKLNDQDVETWDCGTFDYSTEYAWRVDVNHATGTETGTVYYFTPTTEANPPISEASIILHNKNAGIIKYHKNGRIIK